MSNTNQNPLSVSELNRRAKNLLEKDFGLTWLQGEVSGFLAANSGHWYFTLKDSRAQVKCAMFKNRNQFTKTLPKNGDQVIVRAKVTMYEPRGDYQLNVEFIQASGIGSLQQQFEALKQKLTAEGLFSPQYKKAIPSHCKNVALITSSSGAALHDMLTVLKRRNPMMAVTIYPTLVQGTQAAENIATQIEQADINDHDVIIVGRGGGSIEDLWSFNEEVVARAVFQCDTPIISAVGHETDFTICDFVADLRAPTPSAAAELVSVDLSQLSLTIKQYHKRLIDSATRIIEQQAQKLDLLRLTLKNPKEKIHQHVQRHQILHQKLCENIQQKLRLREQEYNNLAQRWAAINLNQTVKNYQFELEKHTAQLHQSMAQILKTKQHQLGEFAAQLDIVSPLATLKRGYSITRNADGHIIKSNKDVIPNEQIQTQTHDGVITSIVTDA